MRTTKSGTASARFLRMAEEQARAAQSTSLPKVRERCLEAERSFLVMADRAEAVEADRRTRAAAVVPKPAARRPRRFGYA